MATRLWWGGRRGTRTIKVYWWWALTFVFIVACIKPLRNVLLYPVWPPIWRDVGSYSLINRHIRDLFYPMDRKPYTGSCVEVEHRLQEIKLLENVVHLNETFRIYSQEIWDVWERSMKDRVDADTLRKLRYFSPALLAHEQRTLLQVLYVASAALEAFNISYVASEGTLIGALRHGGLIPWDDDADLYFKADQWETAKVVLSCIPGYELKIHSDFMWKFFSQHSAHWKLEEVTHFPYVDLFPYVEDGELLWPLVIWLKDTMLWSVRTVYPTRLVAFDNFRIRAPHDVKGTLARFFGESVMTECESRWFLRREKILVSREERIRIPCQLLYEVYPFIEFEQETIAINT